MKTLSQVHPAHKSIGSKRKSYLVDIVTLLPNSLDDQIIEQACRRVGREIGASLQTSFWRRRELERNYRDAIDSGLSVDKVSEAKGALSEFKFAHYDKKRDANLLNKAPSHHWTFFKCNRTFLFLDCCRVLKWVGITDYLAEIDVLAARLKINPNAVATVKAFVENDTAETYLAVCDQLADPFRKKLPPMPTKPRAPGEPIVKKTPQLARRLAEEAKRAKAEQSQAALPSSAAAVTSDD